LTFLEAAARAEFMRLGPPEQLESVKARIEALKQELKQGDATPPPPAAVPSIDNIGRQFAPPQVRSVPVIPDNPLGYRDSLDFLNEMPIAIGRSGTGGELDWQETASVPKYYRPFIASEEGLPIDVVAQAAYEAQLIPQPTADALMERVQRDIGERRQYRVQGRQQQQQALTQEKQALAFDQSQQKVKAKPGAMELPVDLLAAGDELTIDGEPVTVRAVDSDQDGYVTRVVLEDGKKFGVQAFNPQTREGVFVDEYQPRPQLAGEEGVFSRAAPQRGLGRGLGTMGLRPEAGGPRLEAGGLRPEVMSDAPSPTPTPQLPTSTALSRTLLDQAEAAAKAVPGWQRGDLDKLFTRARNLLAKDGNVEVRRTDAVTVPEGLAKIVAGEDAALVAAQWAEHRNNYVQGKTQEASPWTPGLTVPGKATTPSAMASPDEAAQTNSASPGGLTEAEAIELDAIVKRVSGWNPYEWPFGESNPVDRQQILSILDNGAGTREQEEVARLTGEFTWNVALNKAVPSYPSLQERKVAAVNRRFEKRTIDGVPVDIWNQSTALDLSEGYTALRDTNDPDYQFLKTAVIKDSSAQGLAKALSKLLKRSGVIHSTDHAGTGSSYIAFPNTDTRIRFSDHSKYGPVHGLNKPQRSSSTKWAVSTKGNPSLVTDRAYGAYVAILHAANQNNKNPAQSESRASTTEGQGPIRMVNGAQDSPPSPAAVNPDFNPSAPVLGAAAPTERLRTAYRQLDRAGQGYVRIPDLARAAGLTPEETRGVLAELDDSGQAYLTPADEPRNIPEADRPFLVNGPSGKALFVTLVPEGTAVASPSSRTVFKRNTALNKAELVKLGLPTSTPKSVWGQKPVKAAMTLIAKDTRLPATVRRMAKLLQDADLRGLFVRVEADGRKKYTGLYQPLRNGQGELVINLRHLGVGNVDPALNMAETLVHEVLHHATYRALRGPKNDVQKSAIGNLEQLRRRVKAVLGSQQMADFDYQTSNIDEFIAALFTQKPFQDALAGIPAEATPKTLVQQVRTLLDEAFRLLAEIVTGKKVPPGSVLDSAFQNALRLVEDGVRVAATEKVGTPLASMAGPNAQLSEQMRTRLETAQAMAAAGKTSEEIRAVTGWFPGKYDGKMRFEVPDNEARLKAQIEPGQLAQAMKAQAVIDDLNRRGILDTPERADAIETLNSFRANANISQTGRDAARGFGHLLRTGDDSQVVISRMRGGKLADVLDHPALFNAYPELADVLVVPSAKEGTRGSFDIGKNTIEVDWQSYPSEMLSTLLHEIQHWIQNKEGFARGANTQEFTDSQTASDAQVIAFRRAKGESATDASDWFERTLGRKPSFQAMLLADEPDKLRLLLGGSEAAYRRTAGEIESRDVQARQTFTPDQRAAIAPYSSENIAKEDAIVMFGRGGAQSLASPAQPPRLPDLAPSQAVPLKPEFGGAFPGYTPYKAGDMQAWAAEQAQRLGADGVAEAVDAGQFGPVEKPFVLAAAMMQTNAALKAATTLAEQTRQQVRLNRLRSLLDPQNSLAGQTLAAQRDALGPMRDRVPSLAVDEAVEKAQKQTIDAAVPVQPTVDGLDGLATQASAEATETLGGMLEAGGSGLEEAAANDELMRLRQQVTAQRTQFARYTEQLQRVMQKLMASGQRKAAILKGLRDEVQLSARNAIERAKAAMQSLRSPAQGAAKAVDPNVAQVGFHTLVSEGVGYDAWSTAMVRTLGPMQPTQLEAIYGAALNLYEKAVDRLDAQAKTKQKPTARPQPQRTPLAQSFPDLAKMLRKLGPAISGLNWRQIMTSTATAQRQWELDTYAQIRQHPKLSALNPEQARELTRELSKAWQRERRKVWKRELDKTLIAAGMAKPKHRAKIEASAPRLLALINLGALDAATFRDAVAKEFGLRSIHDAEVVKIKEAAEKLQSLTPGTVPHRKAGQRFIEGLESLTGLSKTQLLESWWTAAVLSGWRTQVDIALGVANAMEDVGFGSVVTAVRTGNYGVASRALFAALERAAQAVPEALHLVLTGNRSLQASFDAEIKAALEDGYTTMGHAGRALLSKGGWRKAPGSFLVAMGRIMSALDHVTSSAGRAGALWMARANHPEIYKAAASITAKDRAAARAQALQILTGGVEPTTQGERLEVKRYTQELLDARHATPAIDQQASDVGLNAALQGDPTGLGGVLYEILSAVPQKLDRLPEKYAKRENYSPTALKLLRGAADLGRILFGTKFVRTVGNAFNRATSYVPGIGAVNYTLGTKWGTPTGDVLMAKQMVGLLVGMGLLYALKDREEDDDMGMEGGWSGLTPEQRGQLLAQGKQPYSVWYRDNKGRIQSINYQQWGISNILAMVGTMQDQRRYLGKDMDAEMILTGIGYGLWAIADKAQLSGLGTVLGQDNIRSSSGEDLIKRLNKWASMTVGGLMPRIAKDIDQVMQPQLTRTDHWWQAWAREVPILRTQSSGVRVDIFGRPIELKRGPLSRIYQTGLVEPEYQVLAALNQRDVWISDPSAHPRKVKLTTGSKESRDMTPLEKDRYAREAGRMTKEWLLQNQELLLKAEPEKAQEMISQRTELIRKMAVNAAVRR
jgi:hypothetical protein